MRNVFVVTISCDIAISKTLIGVINPQYVLRLGGLMMSGIYLFVADNDR